MGLILALTLAAILFRLLLFLGRGDYLAFDEGWYLLLARSLYSGEGYSLIGIPHVTLSPLFPVLAGAAGSLLGSWVWGGRVVAAVASGLLVLPTWAIFRRLAPSSTAFGAALLVAVLPSMAPFGVPFFIGADLWVGAEPLLHLFLFTGIALWLKAHDEEKPLLWLITGGAFGLAFLARPEAIITWGLLGLAALWFSAAKRSLRRFAGAVLMGVGLAAVAAPYWGYLHRTTGEWALTGRGINPAANAARMASGAERGKASATIENMLWVDDDAYVKKLYGLDSTGLRLKSSYWGVYPTPLPVEGVKAGPKGSGGGPKMGPTPSGAGTGSEGSGPGEATPEGAQTTPPSFPARFGRAMRTVFPSLLWIALLLGVFAPLKSGSRRKEIPVAGSLVGTSLAIATLVAVDPRTQLFLVPLLAFYAARGFTFLDDALGHRVRAFTDRPRFLEALLLGVTLLWLGSISVNRLYLALSFGSPHHIVAHQNRQVAERLDAVLGSHDGPVASWHPGIAVYADRDWRVLPYADLSGVIRYAGASGARVAVLSAYYPPFQGEEILGTRYLILPIPEEASQKRDWTLEPVSGDSIQGIGRLQERVPGDTIQGPGSNGTGS